MKIALVACHLIIPEDILITLEVKRRGPKGGQMCGTAKTLKRLVLLTSQGKPVQEKKMSPLTVRPWRKLEKVLCHEI